MPTTEETDALYRETLLTPVRVCAAYRPAFGVAGQETVDDLAGFRTLYGADPLYGWLGLDSPLMYAAHKAAGGMTSIYRQLGIGCERLFRQMVQDQLGLDDEQVRWGYDAPNESGKVSRLTLDARIDREHLVVADAVERFDAWLSRASRSVGVPANGLTGAIFEVRQGYKSADSKRQNADLRFGMRARNEHYLPVVLVFSNQVSATVAARYRGSSMLILTGLMDPDDRVSTFAFCESVLGYSLADFFRRNTEVLRQEMAAILQGLLAPADVPVPPPAPLPEPR